MNSLKCRSATDSAKVIEFSKYDFLVLIHGLGGMEVIIDAAHFLILILIEAENYFLGSF